jgi:SHS2 domain-containing protein
MLKEFELISHTADLKMRAYGIDLPELFRNALKGMFASIKPQSPEISYKGDYPIIHHFTSERTVHTRSPDREVLLVDFLSDCLYFSDIYNEAYLDARFPLLSQTELEAIIYGVSITGFEVVEIKAVTYHDLELEQINGIWQATIVFDI